MRFLWGQNLRFATVLPLGGLFNFYIRLMSDGLIVGDVAGALPA